VATDCSEPANLLRRMCRLGTITIERWSRAGRDARDWRRSKYSWRGVLDKGYTLTRKAALLESQVPKKKKTVHLTYLIFALSLHSVFVRLLHW